MVRFMGLYDEPNDPAEFDRHVAVLAPTGVRSMVYEVEEP